jgi:hypothetical protein
MTKDEHKLMVWMFTRQTMLIEALVELLKSRGIVESSDVEAFEALVFERETLDRAILESVGSQYTKFAQLLGIPADSMP